MSRHNNLKYDNDRLAKELKSVLGKVIGKLSVQGQGVDIWTQDGTLVSLSDNNQCCEVRYATSDDDPADFEGATLLGVELADGGGGHGNDRGGWRHDECHEIQFLRIHTSKGDFVVASHNEHNGYYSGFDISVEVKEPAQ